LEKPSCLFCQIAAGELPSDTVFKDEIVTAFRDIHPVAPVHILIIPNKHIQDSNELTADENEIATRMMTVVPEIAKKEGIAESGYRLIMNTRSDGRQEVAHLHLHLIGGKKMQHPMG
jgi:histidine triad (HIT) family protein